MRVRWQAATSNAHRPRLNRAMIFDRIGGECNTNSFPITVRDGKGESGLLRSGCGCD
jgi:hypothetical protein